MTARPRVLTAANAPYARSLWQLLRSAERHGWHRRFDWIVGDLGLGAAARHDLARRFPWATLRDADFSDAPAHLRPESGTCGWKPCLIAEVLAEGTGPLLWLDSAALVTGPPDEILATLADHGVFVLRGQSPLQRRCEPAVLDALGVPGWLRATREAVAGAVGFDPARPWVRALVTRWADCARDPALLTPQPRTIRRHMVDQALLSALLLPVLYDRAPGYPVRDVDISSGRPVRYLTSRNKVRPCVPRAADPLVRAWYWTYKTVDQALIRFDDWFGDVPHRLRRRTEYYLTTVRGPAGDRVLDSPPHRYFADPFPVTHAGQTALLFEDLDFRRMRGRISACLLTDGRPGPVVQALDPGCHVSFPFPFHHDGTLYMVPETTRARRLTLYRCDRFPDRWSPVHDILTDTVACDTVVVPHGGRWWLITSLRAPDPGGDHRYLAVFHADRPDTTDWTEHPVTREGRYIGLRHGSGRNAGPILQRDGRLFRPVQWSHDYYAQGMRWMEITRLTPGEYEETPCDPPPGLAGISTTEGVHHVATLGALTVWDRRTRH